MPLTRRAHDIVRCEAPQRCCYLGDEGDTPCPAEATVEIVDGDHLAPTYACDEHRGVFAGAVFPMGSG